MVAEVMPAPHRAHLKLNPATKHGMSWVCQQMFPQTPCITRPHVCVWGGDQFESVLLGVGLRELWLSTLLL